jgi:hypothetical protein
MKYEEEFRELNETMLGTGISHDVGINKLAVIVKEADEEIADLKAMLSLYVVGSIAIGILLVCLM